jgi:acyl phosphate:glycerol-3-phosphate acyltransferase
VGYAVAVVAGYVAGSIPTGYWFVRGVRHVDIRTLGSGNIGGHECLAGVRAQARASGGARRHRERVRSGAPGDDVRVAPGRVVAGGAAMAFLGVEPVVGAIGAGVWIVSFLLFRYASVASMLAACSLPLVSVLIGEPWPVIAFAGVAAVSVVVLHRANIGRLPSGPRVGSRSGGRRGFSRRTF